MRAWISPVIVLLSAPAAVDATTAPTTLGFASRKSKAAEVSSTMLNRLLMNWRVGISGFDIY